MHHKSKNYTVTVPAFVSSTSKSILTSQDIPVTTQTCARQIDYENSGGTTPNRCFASSSEYFGSVPSGRIGYKEYRFTRHRTPTGFEWDPMTTRSFTSGYKWPGGSTLNTGSVKELDTRIGDACVALASHCITPFMDIPTAIVELKDIPATLKAVPKLVRFARRFPKVARPTVRTIKEVASSYLAYTFGVKPTVSDVTSFIGQVPERVKLGIKQVKYAKGQPVRAGFFVKSPSLEAYTKPNTTSFSRAYTLGMGQKLSEVDIPYITSGANSTTLARSGVVSTPDWPYYLNWRVVGEEVHGCVFGRVAADMAMDISAIGDFRLSSDPLLTAWELLPFSFVVDWFANVGKWLKQANRLSSARKMGFYLQDGIWLSKRTDSVTYTAACSETFSEAVVPSYDATSVSVMCSGSKSIQFHVTARNRAYERVKYRESIRLPSLNIRGIRNLSAFQWTTGSALAIQQCLQGL